MTQEELQALLLLAYEPCGLPGRHGVQAPPCGNKRVARSCLLEFRQLQAAFWRLLCKAHLMLLTHDIHKTQYEVI